jgi:hypothetical protein
MAKEKLTSKFRGKWNALAETIIRANLEAQDDGHYYSIIMAFVQNSSFRMEMSESDVEGLENLLYYCEEKDVPDRPVDTEQMIPEDRGEKDQLDYPWNDPNAPFRSSDY